MVDEFTDDPIRVAGVGASSDRVGLFQRDTYSGVPASERATDEAYEMADRSADDLDFAEVHDCFAIAELMAYEDIGLCERGEAGEIAFAAADRDEPFIAADRPVRVPGNRASPTDSAPAPSVRRDRRGPRPTPVSRLGRIDGYGLEPRTGRRRPATTPPGDRPMTEETTEAREDSTAPRTGTPAARDVVIVGGGYIGLETAASLRSAGLQVTVLEAMSRVLQRVTAPEVSAFFTRVHEEEGVTVVTGTTVSAFHGEGTLSGVTCSDGREFAADLALVGVGVVPDTSLAEAAGLEVNILAYYGYMKQQSEKYNGKEGYESEFFITT